MKNRAFIISILLLLLTIGIDASAFVQKAELMGIFLLTSTGIVFSIGMMWFIHRPDPSLHVKRAWLCIPLTLFGAGLFQVLQSAQIIFQETPEDMAGAGHLLMSRYQPAEWLVGLIILAVFVFASSLLERRS